MSNTTDPSSSLEAHFKLLKGYRHLFMEAKGKFTSQFVITVQALLLMKSRSQDIHVAEKLLKVTIKKSTILKTNFILHVQ